MTRVHWSTWLALAGVVAGLTGILAYAPRASAAMEGLQEPGLELRHVRGWSVTLYVSDSAAYGWSHKRILVLRKPLMAMLRGDK